MVRDVAGNFLDKLAVLDCHPLVEYGMTEAQCLDYCLSKGYDFGGRYNHVARVSCFCRRDRHLGKDILEIIRSVF